MKKDENWAIAQERIETFFRNQTDVQEEDGFFRYRSCEIRLEAISGQTMGRWEIPRTRVIMEGDNSDVQNIHARFFLRFLSAGG